MTAEQGSLPLELTGFVGRRAEIADARRLLSESRLVTLTGLGGVGKTRLALRVAGESRRMFPDGIWFVDLSDLQDPALLEQSVATALGIQDRSARPPRLLLIDHMSGRRALLVLDNCEHLVAPVANLTSGLLRSCPDLRVLATSREPLGVPGEYVMRVPPMEVPDASASRDGNAGGDAVELFEQRAQAAAPDFRLTEHTTAVVAQICRRLDGLPLPIELAAARLRAMSVDQILDRLNDRFELLTRGSRNAPTRQQTLECSIDWSFGLCTPDEQWLWTRLTVFVGGCDLEAIDGVLAGVAAGRDLLDLVTSLVDKSVLVCEGVDATARYRMFDTLRDYGWNRLDDPDERWALQRRHRDWYDGLLARARSEWIGPRQDEWAGRLQREEANLRDVFEFNLTEPDPGASVLRSANAIPDFWILGGRLSEGRYWLDRALAQEGGSTLERIDALATASLLAGLQGDIAAGTTRASEAHRLADAVWDAGATAAATYATGIVAIVDGDLSGGIGHLEAAIAQLRSGDHIDRLVPALYWLGCAYFTLGDVERASPVYEEELALTETHGETLWRAMAMSDYGSTLWRRGSHARGVELLEEAMRMLRLSHNLFGRAWCFEELAWASADRNPGLAALLLGAAETQFAAAGSPMDTFARLLVLHDRCVQTARNMLGARAFDTAVARGRELCPDDVIASALGEQSDSDTGRALSDSVDLTLREAEVAGLVAQGLTNKAIAERLAISQRTVEGHVDHIRDKLGVSSRTRIATWVLQRADAPPDG